MNNVFRIHAKPAKLAKVVTYGLCELRGLGVKNTTTGLTHRKNHSPPKRGMYGRFVSSFA